MSTLNAETTDHLRALAKAKGFLGREFLSWIWFAVENKTEQLAQIGESNSKTNLDLWVDDRVVFEAETGMTRINTLSGGDPSRSEEAAVSLRLGKLVREIRLGMKINGVGNYRCTLSVSNGVFQFKSIELPKDTEEARDQKSNKDEKTDSSSDEMIAKQIFFMESLVKVIDDLFRVFLTERLSSGWESKQLREIRDWARTRRINEKGAVH